jgi:hypothetical protein
MKTLGGYTSPQFLLSFERITKFVLKKSGGPGPISPRGYASGKNLTTKYLKFTFDMANVDI